MIQSIEIFPKVVVYKNIFKDINNTYNILENSDENDPHRIFSKWSKWSTFGKYLQPISTKVNWDTHDIIDGTSHIKDDFNKDQKEVIIEIMQGFNQASEEYFNRYELNIDLDEEIVGHNGIKYKLWRRVAPVICKYDMLSYDNRKMTMKYHSDYIREPMSSPGYKFAITALVYFNDNYEGGEIEFVVGNKLIKYKPESGDLIMFPSGHPEILLHDNNVYLHGVHPITSGVNKMFLRMFWQKYNYGSDEWISKEHEFGKEEWNKEYGDMLTRFAQNSFQRSFIPNAINIEPRLY